ncbi:TPA: hypothetical protein EYP66_05730 [Candidatus Poribacteria bacterium]|nr:hypothetical protein [Candidatus Poribacteria bacterium]
MTYVKELETDENGQIVIGPELVSYLAPNEHTFYCILCNGAITLVPKRGYKVHENGTVEKEPEDEVSLLKRVLAELDEQLEWYEKTYDMSSEEFYEKWCKDEITESFDLNVWASTYGHKQDLMSGKRKP